MSKKHGKTLIFLSQSGLCFCICENPRLFNQSDTEVKATGEYLGQLLDQISCYLVGIWFLEQKIFSFYLLLKSWHFPLTWFGQNSEDMDNPIRHHNKFFKKKKIVDQNKIHLLVNKIHLNHMLIKHSVIIILIQHHP